MNDSILKELAELYFKVQTKTDKIIVRAELFRKINYDIFGLLDLKRYYNDVTI